MLTECSLTSLSNDPVLFMSMCVPPPCTSTLFLFDSTTQLGFSVVHGQLVLGVFTPVPESPPPSFLLFSFSIQSRRGGADVVVDLVDTVTFPQWNRRPMLPLLLLLLSKNSSLHHLPRVSLSLSFYFISKKKGNTKTRNGWLPIKKIDD